MRNCRGQVAESALSHERQAHHSQQVPFVAVCGDDSVSEQLQKLQMRDNLLMQERTSAVSASPSSVTDTATERCVTEYIDELEPKKKLPPAVATVKPFSVRPLVAIDNVKVDPLIPLGAGGHKIAEVTPRRSAQQHGGERLAERLMSTRSGGRHRAVVDPNGTADPTPRVVAATSVNGSRVDVVSGARKTVDSRRMLVGEGQPAVAVSAPTTMSSSSDRRTKAASGSDASLCTPSVKALPDGYARVARCLHQLPSSERDEERLIANCRLLEQCSFYSGSATSNDAKDWLRDSRVGTFLVRDSAHPRYLYSLSVKTRRGITSIRLAYDPRGFALDSDPDQVGLMPVFETVVELVSFYAAEGRRTAADGDHHGQNKSSCVFLERSGRRDLPVFLRFPHRGGGASQSGVSSLKHLSRLSINGALDGRCPDRLVIQPSLKEYLKQYPYDI